jgi:hypothetical protein
MVPLPGKSTTLGERPQEPTLSAALAAIIGAGLSSLFSAKVQLSVDYLR